MSKPKDKTVLVDTGGPAPVSLPFEDRRGTSDTVGYINCVPLNRLHTAAPSLGTMVCRYGGALRLVVIVKAAFSMKCSPMEPVAAPPMYLQDEHHRGQPMARVLVANDLVPGRSRVDVTLDGHVRAPGGHEVGEMAVRLTLRQDGNDALDKTLIVAADEGKLFATMPLGYERALQGEGEMTTPIGVMEGEQVNIRDPKNPKSAAGFGPISQHWPMRRGLLTKEQRKQLRQPVMNLPADFDWRFFQAAPPDQQLDHLAPDAEIAIAGFDAEAIVLEGQLPDAQAKGVVFGLQDDPMRPTELSFRADSLHIHADKAECLVTWRAIVEIASEAVAPSLLVAAGVETTLGNIELPKRPPKVTARRKKPIVLPDQSAPSKGATMVLESRGARKDKTLPFQPSAPVSKPQGPPAPPAPPKGGLTETAYVPASASKGPELPFEKSSAPKPPKTAAADLGPAPQAGSTEPAPAAGGTEPPAPEEPPKQAPAPAPPKSPPPKSPAPEQTAAPKEERPPERVIKVPTPAKRKPKKKKKKKPGRRISEGPDLNAILYGKKK